MTNKEAEPDSDISAMGLIAHGLIQGHLGPDHKVIDMEQFFAALIQGLHDAYAQGWKDRGLVRHKTRGPALGSFSPPVEASAMTP